MTTSRVFIVCVIFIVLMTIIAGCIQPRESSSSGSSGGSSWFSGGNKGTSGSGGGNDNAGGGSTGSGSSAGTSPTPSPTETSYLMPATPFPVETPPPTTSSYTRLAEPTTPVPPEYVAIFYDTPVFKQNRTAYTYQLERPPMIIEMCIKPNMTTRTIWYETKSDERKTQTVTSVSPAAWFEVTVRDQATGTVVAQEGYARSYSVDTAKKITIRYAGTYLIEFAGNDLSAEIQIQVPKTATQTGEPLRTLSCGSLLL